MSEKPDARPWSKERIEALLKREIFRYQSVPLPHGMSTPGHDRSATARTIFPKDMTGQTVLDVGSALGFFCFEAAARGARRALGVDLDAENVRKARLLAEAKGVAAATFECRDLELDPIDETFDHVLCLNVLHHLLDPIRALDRLIELTRRRLVLEVATFGAHDRKKLGMRWLEQLFVRRLPVMVIPSGAVSEGIKQFYFTRRSLENLLRYRRGCFASVEVVDSEFKGRFLVLAHPYQIDRLKIVAAPTAALANEAYSHLESRSDAGAAVSSRDAVIDAEAYHADRKPRWDEATFLYDFMRPFNHGAITHDHDPAIEIADRAEEIDILTHWQSPREIAEGIARRHANARGRERKRVERLLAQCRDPRRLVAHYRQWFDFTKARFPNARHRVVDGSATERSLMSVSEWEERYAMPLAESASKIQEA